MSKIAHYLQEHLLGEISEGTDACNYFSTDNSIFQIRPSLVVYPRNEHDIRKTARFSWQLSERGRVIPITARGAGTDLSGAAIGSGIIIAFPAHMNRVIQLDTKTGNTIVEPGLSYGRLQQTLHTHDRFLPPYPASMEYSTIGGAVANNAAGAKSYKYGNTLRYVKSLRVVLANGEVITTGKLSKREFNKKLGLSTFEGEIYRQLDALLEDNRPALDELEVKTSKNATGYNLAATLQKDGTLDLTPLFVGSQGTLGIITEITLTTEEHNPNTTVVLASFDSIDSGIQAAEELRNLSHPPSVLDFVDKHLLSFVQRLNPNQLRGCFDDDQIPTFALLIEFDNPEHTKRKMLKQTESILSKLASSYSIATAANEQARLWKVRQSTAGLISHGEQNLRALPIIEDAVIPVDKFNDFFAKAYKLFTDSKLQTAFWGSAGDGNIHVMPFFDISQLGDRQRLFRLYEAYYRIILELGGSTSGQHNDGRIRGPLLKDLYGESAYSLFEKVKKIFDPYDTMNPGVKVGISLNDIKPHLRQQYRLEHLHSHQPRF